MNFFNSLHSKNIPLKHDQNFILQHEIYLNFDELIAFCDFLLEKNDVDFVLDIISEIQSIFNNDTNFGLNTYVNEILDASLISILLKTNHRNKNF